MIKTRMGLLTCTFVATLPDEAEKNSVLESGLPIVLASSVARLCFVASQSAASELAHGQHSHFC